MGGMKAGEEVRRFFTLFEWGLFTALWFCLSFSRFGLGPLLLVFFGSESVFVPLKIYPGF